MNAGHGTLQGGTIPAAVVAAAHDRPSAPALVSEEGTITFAVLVRLVDGYAAALAGAGVRPGAVVGQVVGDRPIDLAMQLALFRAGAATFALMPQEAPAPRRALLDRLGAEICVGAAADRGGQDGAWVDYEELSADADPRGLPRLPVPGDVAHYNRSSGTTGEAKLVGITHAQRAIRAARETAGFRRRRDDRLLAALPLSNTWARCMALSELANGGAVVFRPATMTFGDLRRMAEAGTITSVALTPPYVRDLLRANGNALMLPGVRVLVASAPLTRAERARTRARITPELFIEYATNETGPLAFATPEDLDEAPDCVGRVVDGVDAEVVDEALRPVPPGSMGELRFRDPMFPSRYAVAASGSTSRFVDGWFYPGDAGTIDSASRITVHGRIDDVINVGGSKVHPAAIESWLTADPRVIEATAIGLPELRQGEAPVAAVVLHEPVAESELMALCRAAGDRLPMPARIVALPELPRNPAGKVDRAALRELLRARLGG